MFKRSAQLSFSGVNIKPITDLRMTFEVDKHDGEQLNHAVIEVYNLSPAARSELARPFKIGYALVEPIITVFLKAGYEGQEVQLIAGELLTGTNTKDGPDWVTRLEVWSGVDAINKARVGLSFAKTTTAQRIVEQLLEPLGLDVTYTATARKILGRSTVSDYTAYGLSFRETARFLRRYRLAFTIEESGQGLVYLDDQARNPEGTKTRGNTFSPDSGLVGAPTITRTGVEIRALLRPRIRLLERFFVESATVRGTLQGNVSADYHVTSIRHIGDTRGEDWHTEIEGAYSNLVDGDYS